jgi:hypothetical protein
MVFQTYLTLLVLDDDDRRMRFINGDVNGVYQYGGVQDGNGGVQDGNGGVQNGNGGVQYRNGGNQYENGGVLFGGIQNNNQQQTVDEYGYFIFIVV